MRRWLIENVAAEVAISKTKRNGDLNDLPKMVPPENHVSIHPPTAKKQFYVVDFMACKRFLMGFYR